MLANRCIIKFFKLSEKLLSVYKWKQACNRVSLIIWYIVSIYAYIYNRLKERGCCWSLSRKSDSPFLDRSPEHK